MRVVEEGLGCYLGLRARVEAPVDVVRNVTGDMVEADEVKNQVVQEMRPTE